MWVLKRTTNYTDPQSALDFIHQYVWKTYLKLKLDRDDAKIRETNTLEIIQKGINEFGKRLWQIESKRAERMSPIT